MEFHHKSVLLWEVIEGLAIKPDGVYVAHWGEQDMQAWFVPGLVQMGSL